MAQPTTAAVVQTRAQPLGIEVEVGDHETFAFGPDVCGGLIQYPATDGRVLDYADFAERCHALGYPAYKMHGWAPA